MDDYIREFIAGGVGGVCFTLVLHPYDTVKVLTQTNTQRMGSIRCFETILKNEVNLQINLKHFFIPLN